LPIGTLQKQKNVKQPAILSKLRDLQPVVDKLLDKIMALIIDYKKDAYYKRGKKEAKEELIASLLLNNKLSHDEIAEIAKVSLLYIARLEKKLKQNNKEIYFCSKGITLSG
jgi:hypothetical protein